VCCYRIKLGTPISYRSGVTELPGLTSDPILAADRRGGILISFGPNRRPRRVINPSSWPRFLVRCGREIDPDRTALAYHPSARFHLRASERTDDGSTGFGWICNRHFDGVHRNVAAVRRDRTRAASAFQPNARFHLRASDWVSVDPTHVGWFCVCIPSECPYILKGIGPGICHRTQMVCARGIQVENTGCLRGSVGVGPHRECIQFDGQD
jgi:hypothetical protein